MKQYEMILEGMLLACLPFIAVFAVFGVLITTLELILS